jgi:hypothetical protein
MLNLTTEQQQLLKDVPDRMFRETVRDFMVNSQFRRDYWVRGARPLSMAERIEALRPLRFVMVVPREQVTLKVKGVIGEADMTADIYNPILDYCANYRVVSFQELAAAVEPAGLNLDKLIQALLILVSKGVLQPAQDEAAINAALPAATRLNRKLCEQARHSDAVMAVASPVIGGAINLSRVDKLFLLALGNGITDPEAAAHFLIGNLALAGSRITKEGKMPETPEAELDEAIRLARGFSETLLPMLNALRIAC